MSSTTSSVSQPQPQQPSFLSQNKYPILVLAYLTVTGLAFARINRQPYPRSMKAEQYETVFKGTTLGAVLIGVGLGGGLGMRRSESMRGSGAGE